jgi:hypothetical protein
MKRIQKITLALTGIVLAGSLTYCSKERIETPKLNNYAAPDKFQNTNKQQEQVYTINKGGVCPLICTQGSQICIDSSVVVYANGNTATYPFTLKVVELYSAKDLILYNVSNASGAKQLSTAGTFRIKAFIGNEELAVKGGKTYSLTTKAISTTDPAMALYYGTESANLVSWIAGNSGQVVVNPTNYLVKAGQSGWVSPSDPLQYAGGTGNVNVTSTKDNLSNIPKFIYFDKAKSLMLLNGSSASNVPVGEHATIICFALDPSGALFYYTKSFTTASSNSIDVTMQPISEAALLALLGTL